MQCPAGSRTVATASISQADCNQSVPGYYKTADGSIGSCAIGSYSSAANATSCTRCPSGSTTTAAASNSQSLCTQISPGYFKSNGVIAACPTGTFSAANNASSCTTCPAGTTTLFAASTGCTSAPGYYVAGGGVSQCAVGSFSDSIGATSCTVCPAGYTTAAVASASASACSVGRCGVGNGVNSANQCAKCAAGTYSSKGATCDACPAGFYCDGKILPAGFGQPASQTPTPCPTGSTSAALSPSVGNCMAASAATTAAAPSQVKTAGGNDDFYWAGQYFRDAGVVEEFYCPSDREFGAGGQSSGLCYEKTRPGYDCKGTTTCVGGCPDYDDYDPQELTCSLKPEKLVYGAALTSCRDGYQLVAGVCYNRKPTPVTKPSYTKPAGITANKRCPSNHPEQPGGERTLCYQNCASGYAGGVPGLSGQSGNVCYAQNPGSGFVKCGLGFAKSQDICNELVFTQTIAGFNAGLSISSFVLPFAPVSAEAKNHIKNRIKQGRKVAETIQFLKDNAEVLQSFSTSVETFLTNDARNAANSLGQALVSSFGDIVAGRAPSFDAAANAFKNGDYNRIATSAKNLLQSIGMEIYPEPTNLTQQELTMWRVRYAFGMASTLCGIAQESNEKINANQAITLVCDSFDVIAAFTYTQYTP